MQNAAESHTERILKQVKAFLGHREPHRVMRVPVGVKVQSRASSYFDSRSVLQKRVSVLFVFQGETSEHLWRSLEQHAGLELQAALVHKNT